MTEERVRPQTSDHNVRFWLNWVLAVLTIVGAALVMIVAMGAVMSTAGCSTAECPDLGPSGFVFGVLYYGAPAIAALTILVSLFTARRRRGFVVPLVGWGLLAADVLALVIAFRR